MTRINAFIPPASLSDKHLLAEHREIKRIPNTVKSGRAILKDIPDKFTLGKGHVRFFYNKLKFLHKRYIEIYKECLNRGFNITNYSDSFNKDDGSINIPYFLYLELYNDYDPETNEKNRVIRLLEERIKSRLQSVK